MALGKITRIYKDTCLTCTGSNDLRAMGYFIFNGCSELIWADDEVQIFIEFHSWHVYDPTRLVLVVDNELTKCWIYKNNNESGVVVMDIGV